MVRTGIDAKTGQSRLVVCDPLYTFTLHCDQQHCANWNAPMTEKFNFQFGGCFFLPDLNFNDWLNRPSNIDVKVKFWNPIIQTSSPSGNGSMRFYQRSELFDDASSFVSEMVRMNPELGGLDGTARFGTQCLYNPELDELVGSAPGTAWGQGCIFTSEKNFSDRNVA